MSTRGAVFEWMNRKETNQIKYGQNLHNLSYKECKAALIWTCHCGDPFIRAGFEKDSLRSGSVFRWDYHSKLTSWNFSFPRHFLAQPLHHYNALFPPLIPGWPCTGSSAPRKSVCTEGHVAKAKLPDRGKEQPGRSCAPSTPSHLKQVFTVKLWKDLMEPFLLDLNLLAQEGFFKTSQDSCSDFSTSFQQCRSNNSLT